MTSTTTEYKRQYYLLNRDKILTKRREWRAQNRDKMRAYYRNYRVENNGTVITYGRDYRRRLRMLALQAYSGEIPQCKCCSEKTTEFLCIDHINGGGIKHRKSIRANSKCYDIYSWLKKNKFPPGFQVLCHNCNMAKGFYGQCPHNRHQG